MTLRRSCKSHEATTTRQQPPAGKRTTPPKYLPQGRNMYVIYVWYIFMDSKSYISQEYPPKRVYTVHAFFLTKIHSNLPINFSACQAGHQAHLIARLRPVEVWKFPWILYLPTANQIFFFESLPFSGWKLVFLVAINLTKSMNPFKYLGKKCPPFTGMSSWDSLIFPSSMDPSVHSVVP